MTIKIKRIDIKAFRGIPELSIDLDGKNLLVRGDNGTGKSSLIDAIEFFFRGKVAHFEKVQGLSLQKHATHVNFSSNEVNVGIAFNPGNIDLIRTYGDAPKYPAKLSNYFITAESSKFILRRSQILEFIENQPADRFRTITNIIGIEKLDEYELTLMRVRDELDTAIKSKENLIESTKAELGTILKAKITSTSDVLDALNKYLIHDELPQIISLDQIDKHAETIRQAVRQKEDIAKIETIESLLITTKEAIDTDGISSDLKNLNKKYIDLPKSTASDRFVADLLGTGLKVMQSWNKNFCPLCEQKITNQDLIEGINRRLKLVQDLSLKASELRVAAGTTKTKIEVILTKSKSVASKLQQVPELAEEKTNLTEYGKNVEKLIRNVDAVANSEKEISLEEHKSTLSNIVNSFSKLSKKCEELSQKWKITENDRKLIKAAELIGEVRGKLKDLTKYTTQKAKDERYYLVSKELYSSFSEIKKTKVQNVFDLIQNDMNDYYSLLHPNDKHKNIRLKLSSGKRASLELKIESFGKKDEDPRAFSSEGHLDSLGLCIFLAFVKKFNAEFSLIVLDDVVTTVDAGHRERICKLLQNEFVDRQLVITTHDEVWFRQLRAHHRAAKTDGDFNYITIINWDVDSGPNIRPYKTKWAKIQEKIKNGDKGAGNDGRIYLESILETICESMEAPVKFRISKEYEIGHLFPPAKNRLEKLIKDAGFKATVMAAFTNVESTVIYGNILSHNNPLADQLSIQEVTSFCEAVNNLYLVFLCPHCGSYIKYFNNIQKLRCSNTKCGKFEVEAN